MAFSANIARLLDDLYSSPCTVKLFLSLVQIQLKITALGMCKLKERLRPLGHGFREYCLCRIQT
jgi:hypothetical protein